MSAACPLWSEEVANSDSVQAGHKLAVIVCANCHVAAADQPSRPILQPPAASFESVAQRKSADAAWLENFLKTTHRGLDQPNGMPNPQLLDFQIKQVTDYLLSLRKD
jgi:mono/diheme cytochrome c family protein